MIGHQWFFKKRGTPDGKTNGLGFAISGPIIHTNISGEKIHKKFLLRIFNFDLNVNKYPILPLFTVMK
jgi:hypothetical protein